jgi:hypothetical protein
LEVGVAKRKREIPKPKSVVGKSSVKSISSEYAEVLRLRQAVRQAEIRNGASKSDELDGRPK